MSDTLEKNRHEIKELKQITTCQTKALDAIWKEVSYYREVQQGQETRRINSSILKFQCHWKGYLARKRYSIKKQRPLKEDVYLANQETVSLIEYVATKTVRNILTTAIQNH